VDDRRERIRGSQTDPAHEDRDAASGAPEDDPGLATALTADEAKSPDEVTIEPLHGVPGEPSAADPIPPSRSGFWHWGPIGLVAAVVLFNLIEVRSETTFVPLLNDSSMHAQMVREATYQLSRWHVPLTSWYPYLGLGSPQFLHYQSLGAMLTGAVGLVIGANHAFAWSIYLLWSLWPISIYLSARIFGWDRWTASVAAACSPFLFSVPGVGYESTAYLWNGFGVWAQLLAMWTLPLAWAFSWQTVSKGRRLVPAIVMIGLTMAFHFETGYLAILAVPLWVLITPREFKARLKRGAVLLAYVFLLTAWVTVPLIVQGKWASVNEFLQGGPDVNSYGARQVLDWLVHGQLFDSWRLPVVTVLVGLGIIASIARWRRDERSRALLVVFALSLVLFFGRTTLGPLINLLPGSKDLFLRRFMMGVQLAGLFLAGVGATATFQALRGGISSRVTVPQHPATRYAAMGGVIVLIVLLLAPAWSQTASYDQVNSQNMTYQQQVDSGSEGQDMALIAAQIETLGPGYVYAGLPDPDWGSSFTVGQVPVFKYLSNLDLPVVGYTLRTASLMTDPEAYFDGSNAGDYAVFGIRYLVLPSTMAPVPKAQLVLRESVYTLWEIPSNNDISVVDTTLPISADRTNIGAQTQGFLDSSEPSEGLYPTISFAGAAAAPPTLPPGTTPDGPAGSTQSQSIDLLDGTASAVIIANRTAAVVLRASFDPGWTVTVDGQAQQPYMIAPALVAVTVPPGRHVVSFTYQGFGGYPWLFLLALLTALTLTPLPRTLERRIHHRSRARHSEVEASPTSPQ
jgi:hypothetical protein